MWSVNGNVGIGTMNPQTGLHLYGQTLRVSSTSPSAYLMQGFTNGGTNDDLGLALHDGANSNSPYLWIAKAGSSWGGPADKMVIASSKNAGTTKDLWIYANDNLAPSAPNLLIQANTGNVGVGTNNPGSYKLAVEGKLGARKVVVTQTSPWPDYVFYSSYKLPTLREVEDYIKQHKHLPDVPSAREVEKNGLDVGENQAILLKKMEELTLYVIDQQKQITDLKSTVDSLTKRKTKTRNAKKY